MEFRTKDDKVIVIDKGGQQLPDNTYGFEIEFCTHDSSVFAFTHVDVANLRIVDPSKTELGSDDKGVVAKWKIETDSGNVLELVTTPIVFATVERAYETKAALADGLVTSVSPSEISLDTVNAVSFKTWHEQVLDVVSPIATQIYGSDLQVGLRLKDWQKIGAQLTKENVDDGINIKAALLRYQMNEHQWPEYVSQTALCRSEKDWGKGYSSQVNMPMTVEGYFLYVAKKKLIKSQARIKDIVSATGLDEVGDSTLQQRVTTWFWRSVIAAVCNRYVSKLFGVNVSIREVEVSKVSMALLKQVSLVYVATNKILTGALGALSEPNQLKLQNIAWREQSTEAMVADSPYSYAKLLQSSGVENWAWLEYHSSLKDLTGLWFKAALLDVMDKENLGADFYGRLGGMLADDKGETWNAVLHEQVSSMKGKEWDKLWTAREGYTDDLADLNWKELLNAIVKVEKALADRITDFIIFQPLSAESYFELPPKKERKFLHYSEAPPWEGRYDTMVQAIRRPDGQWTYLVEHRFN